MADAGTNPTTNDAIEFCVSNHNQNFEETGGTVGSLRRRTLGAQAEQHARIRDEGTALKRLCTESQNPG